MLAHLRANLWLLVLTVLICSVLYPLVLLGVGQTLFKGQAQGSLIYDKNGKPVGSRLIAQEFKGDEYFQSRPSAASYKADASGASNYAASNYALRDRVARTLGPIVKYRAGPKKGQLVAPDVVAWFRRERPDLVAEWADAHNSLAQAWVKSEDGVTNTYVEEWAKTHPDEVAQWKKENPGTPEPKAEDLAVPFFQSFSKEHPGAWLEVKETKNAKGETEKHVELVKEGEADIAAVFFDLWRQAHPDVELEDVPADLVMTSGSGLDPHITLQNALYQLDRVAHKWAEVTGKEEARVREKVEELLRRNAAAPLGGLVGVELINVLEVNLALHDGYVRQALAGK